MMKMLILLCCLHYIASKEEQQMLFVEFINQSKSYEIQITAEVLGNKYVKAGSPVGVKIPAWIHEDGATTYFTVRALDKNKVLDEKSFKLSWGGAKSFFYAPGASTISPYISIDYNKYSKPKGFVVNLPSDRNKGDWKIETIDPKDIPHFDIDAYLNRQAKETARRKKIEAAQEAYEREMEEEEQRRTEAYEELGRMQEREKRYGLKGQSY
jgi:hypothetical protein